MKKLFIATLAVLMLTAFSSITFAKTIKFATEGAWAPFNFVDASGEARGFDVDIAKALCAEMKVDCEIVIQDWDGLIPALKLKKFDAIVASMSITEERLKQVDFTNSYYSGGLRFMGKKKKDLTLSKTGLKGKNIGAQRSTVASAYLEKHYGDFVNVKLYDTQDNVYLDLISGRLDGALSDELPTYNWLKSKDGKDFEFVGEAFAKDDKIGIAVRKGDDLREKINAALTAIVNNGTYEKINAKYFPFSIY